MERETGLSASLSVCWRFALAQTLGGAPRPLKTIHRIVFLTGLRAPLITCPFIRGRKRLLINGAGDGARTRHLSLGKAALYQMSYSRKSLPQTDCGGKIGTPSGIRTLDTLIKSQVL